MINIHEAIYALNPSVVSIRGDVAYDANEQVVAYDLAAAEAKLEEMQLAELAEWQDKDTAKQTAMAKLAKLGLTEAEISALTGN
jgi:hypothetical protein